MKRESLNTVIKILTKKLVIILLIGVTGATAFATLGDGKAKSSKTRISLLSTKSKLTSGSFSLKSGYNYRGSQVINTETEKFVNLNTVVTYQRGNTTYIMPLKKRVILDKITFNPNAATRRY